MLLTQAQIQQFKIDGYLLLPKQVPSDQLLELRSLVERHLTERVEPFELEADVHYPGAPESRDAQGGETIRRLKLAYTRAPQLAAMANLPSVVNAVQQILDSKHVLLNPYHHNCVMTKQPEFSSETLWHRDTRYWNFNNKYLINSWLAIGEEKAENGAMKILPGSHRWEVAEYALDGAQFLITDHPDTIGRLSTARTVEMQAGDLLLFSAHCFHAAGRNQTDQSKFALVYTFHGEDTRPLPNTHSASGSEIVLK